MLKSVELPQSIQIYIKEFYSKNIRKLAIQKYLFSSLYVYCRKKERKADRSAMKEVWRIVFPITDSPGIFQDLAKLTREFLMAWQLEDSGRLLVTPDWLKGWFYLQICAPQTESESINAYLKKDKADQQYSPDEILAFLRHLAVLGLYLIHWMDLSNWMAEGKEPRFFPHRGAFKEVEQGPRAQMTALLYLMAEYAHIEGGLRRRAELFKTLEEVWSNEAVLYTLRDTYRDHINHMLETCLLGLLLMDLKKPDGGSEYFSGLMAQFEGWDRMKLVRNWILAALLHDTGYALEICRQAGHSLKFMGAPRLRQFAQDFDGWFKEGEKATLANITECLGKALPWLRDYDFQKFDHGVISAYFTLFLVTDRVRDQREPDKDWREDVRPALDAMARHNLKRLSTSYASTPLAFLLILCDHLQEWDRPLVKGAEMRHSLVVNLLGKAWSGIDTDSLVRYLEVHNVVFDKTGLSLVRGAGPSFILHFQDSWKDRYHPPPTWLSNTYDFQNLTDVPGEITLSLVHPIHPGRGPEMDVFQSFLRQHPDLAGLREWAVASRLSRGWFSYKVEKISEGHYDPVRNIRPGKYEVYSYHLHRDRREPIITEIPEGYIGKYLAFWKERFASD